MNIQCPHCHKAFKVDETDYAAIQQQVRNAEFDKEIARRLQEIDLQHKAEEKARSLEVEHKTEKMIAEKENEKSALLNEIEQLKSKIDNFENEKKADLAEAAASKVKEIAEIKSAKDSEIAELKSAKETEIAKIKSAKDSEITELKLAKASEIAEVKSAKESEIAKLKSAKDSEIAELRNTITELKNQYQVDMMKAQNELKDDIHAKEQAITELNSKLEAQKVTAENTLLEVNNRHKEILKAKDEEIERYRDLKSRLSTKMLGETLELHCFNMFNLARSHGQFPNAYFEKDNDTSIGGTKGDFIFRDFLNGEEYISIMFEMKNEDDRTATKHKNEDFFAKLDKDRRDKKCEYAILVSTLEADSDLYNEGIVDVSYRYEKMLVVRPQFFMAVISLLSRTALRGAQQLISLKKEVEIAKAQSIDVTKFEERRDKFVSEFSRLVNAHLKKQDDALEEIDKAIAAAERQANNLRGIKAMFETSQKSLIRANEKAENDFTIRRLTYGNPTMRKKFEEARKQREQDSEGEE